MKISVVHEINFKEDYSMKKTGLNWWCDRAWIKFSCVIAVIMTGLILLNWEKWSMELKMIAAIAALIPIHVIEEWVFPGGFHYQFNCISKSDQLDRYPMCRLTDMITNIVATLFYVFLTVLSLINGKVSNGIILGTIIFCALELVVHTIFGIIMYDKFKAKGKTTIYGPGSLTAYFGFTVFGIILMFCLKERMIVSSDWIGAVEVVGFILFVCLLLPDFLFKKKDNHYYFESNGYFNRFEK